ncbi:MAG TPA: VOC family protein [Ktedonobacterales bacterium]|nr:VOC family protein [Ktedonobacterales bacterium]
MRLTIDHVTIAAPRLDLIERAFTDAGMTPEYGGAHSNGATHMDTLGFDDGSYIELISRLSAEGASPMWDTFIVGDAGPCAWAVATDDIAGEAERVRALGIPVQGPAPLNRTRPDGTLIEWELAFLGEGSPGATLPFLIQDKTPRAWRIQPSASVSASELRGVAGVALAVPDLDVASALFQRVFEWPEPELGESDDLDARLAHFADTPVTLATPRQTDGWLALRLERFGPAPCAIFLASDDLGATVRRLPLVAPSQWMGRELRWVEPDRLHGARIGVLPL